jgi:hypothetical protein
MSELTSPCFVLSAQGMPTSELVHSKNSKDH